MHPYVQNAGVTNRRMRDLMTRSERIRHAHVAKRERLAFQPVALRDPGELVQIVRLQADDQLERCADERIAS